MNKYDFNDLSDKDLDELMRDVQQERDRRANARKEKLIDAFRKAFDALNEAGYEVSLEGSLIFNFDDLEIH